MNAVPVQRVKRSVRDGIEGTETMKKKTISKSILKWLLLIVAVAFAVSMIFSWTMQTRMSQRSAANLLRLNIQDVRQDVIDASDANLLELTRTIGAKIDNGAPADNAGLLLLMERYDVAEINVIDAAGIIIASTQPEFVDYDMASGTQSGEFRFGRRCQASPKEGPLHEDPRLAFLRSRRLGQPAFHRLRRDLHTDGHPDRQRQKHRRRGL